MIKLLYKFIKSIKLTWKDLAKLGENKLINRSYWYLLIVPAAARLFSKIESPISVNFSGHPLSFDISLPFSWEFFYLAAMLFTLASIIYSISAPTIVRQNDSYMDFIASHKNSSHLHSYMDEMGINLSWLARLGRDSWVGQEEEGRTFSIRLEKISSKKDRQKARLWNDRIRLDRIGYKLDKDKPEGQGYQNSFFWKLYEYSNTSRRLARNAATFFYAGGVICIAIVVIQGSIDVLKQL